MVVTDVYPRGLHDELVVGQVVADVHVGLGHEVLTHYEVGSLAGLVLALTRSAYEAVDTGMAITAGDADGHLEVLAQGLKDMLAEKAEVLDDFVRGHVGDAM